MNPYDNRRRGFTLIELLLVILILGMLAGVGIYALMGTRAGAKIDTTKRLLDVVSQALDTYSMHIGHYPTEAEGGLKALLEKPQYEDETLGDKWRGPYLKKEPVDAWGNALNYELVEPGSEEGITQPFKLSSNGPDGQPDTTDDIRNWTEANTSSGGGSGQ